MTLEHKTIEELVIELRERRKELNCIFRVEEALSVHDRPLEEVLQEVVHVIPPGWQYPHICEVRIAYMDNAYYTDRYKETPWILTAPIIVQEKTAGKISVVYLEEMPAAETSVFLAEEVKLLGTIAERLSHYLLYHNLRSIFKDSLKEPEKEEAPGEWRIVIDMIRKTDPNLFMSILRKLLHLLCWNDVEEADELLKQLSLNQKESDDPFSTEDDNRPSKKRLINNYDEYIEAILRLSQEHLSDDEILARVQKWIQEDKSIGLVKVVESEGTSLAEIGDAIRKYYHLAPEKVELSQATIRGLRASLLRRFFTNDLEFISIAKEYVRLTDFYRLIDKMIFPPTSHGKLGGKSSGLFLAANILLKGTEHKELFSDIKIPKTWYLTSDCILSFMHYNNLEEVLEQKYKEIDEVRMEYPHIVQLFKNSQFPPDIVKGLSLALDEFGDRPLVVRSSSLLEDQLGAAFSGKYKSLFLANRGTKSDRLNDLMDAIAEVYASTFAPDPIEYRAERGLLDYHEEMGIMIMEVVGNKIGDYFMPSYAGVAFSNNEFRWSPRIKREDGLVRLVAGLGTRAVDRIGDDYPVLVAPGQPNLSVNVTVQEKVRYAQKKIDVINLKENRFETVSLDTILKESGHDYPEIENVVSHLDGTIARTPRAFDLDFDANEYIVTFEGLITNTKFLSRIHAILRVLQAKYKTPIDIEFASDGKDFYLLQCRPQSFSRQNKPDIIPAHLPKDHIVFSANKYISNGKVPDITHIVYVDPVAYSEISSQTILRDVGRAVGRLNKMLPKRRFILMGPGRWGSRGDIKLGVNVTYSDINNTSMLIEIARKKEGYVPDLSFGTHFFQDLVEASIRYLPLYPDDEGNLFNDAFFKSSPNLLPEMLPEYEHLKDVLMLIDVMHTTGGNILRILMNAEAEKAVAVLQFPNAEQELDDEPSEAAEWHPSVHSRWRFKMAEKVAAEIDPERFGVKGIYVFGSTKNNVASSSSDINLIVHYDGDKDKRCQLEHWFEGWSLCLSEMNYLRTGYQTNGLLDVHFVTDEEVAARTEYAAKIEAATNAARALPLKNSARKK